MIALFISAIRSKSWKYLKLTPRSTLVSLRFLKKLQLGLSENASPLSSVLTSRGNYTLFVPTNEALKAFIHDKLEVNSIDELTDEQKKTIAYNCIIDNGDQSAYELSDFPANGTTFNIATLDDRLFIIYSEE